MLLEEARFQFNVSTPDVAEREDIHLTARELTGWNAVRKGLLVARRHPDHTILSADTVVSLHGRIIGKPADLPDAIQILQRLSGKTHEVYSSVFVAYLAESKANLVWEVSQVRFRALSAAQIREYLGKINPLDKAGGYAAQGYGAEIITRIEGSYSNVVGLPMEQTTKVLRQFGIRPKET